MTEEIRLKALRSLDKVRAAEGTELYFPFVFVVGTHLFYTFMAAVRQRNSMMIEEGIHAEIEIVRTLKTKHVKTQADQRGALMRGETFPNKEFARLINS